MFCILEVTLTFISINTDKTVDLVVIIIHAKWIITEWLVNILIVLFLIEA